ncbi:hypothetical protein NMY22_g4481 [Coprinellus aureogranulatus]|nr:hypothetical protein NMY22_g4481 [Coprinellus aureogranulatus]
MQTRKVELRQLLPSIRTTDVDPLFSTLRFAPDDFTQDFNIVQDYRDKTVLAGLASVGGLATTFSTFLVIFFGTSLMRSVIRSKPYSPFGLFHKIPDVKDSMIKKRDNYYWNLKKDLNGEKLNPGVKAYLFDTLIDLDALDPQKEKEKDPVVKVDPPETGHQHSEELKGTASGKKDGSEENGGTKAATASLMPVDGRFLSLIPLQKRADKSSCLGIASRKNQGEEHDRNKMIESLNGTCHYHSRLNHGVLGTGPRSTQQPSVDINSVSLKAENTEGNDDQGSGADED